VAGIYLIDKSGNLVELQNRPYDSEAHLQELLARYPNLLASDQMNRAEPRRWLLIAREMGLPSEEDGSNRWSVDHLFLDQDGIPTIVEVKRSSDSRIRREVIGQMLDYAANRQENPLRNAGRSAGKEWQNRRTLGRGQYL
jgi:hypothetical protein